MAKPNPRKELPAPGKSNMLFGGGVVLATIAAVVIWKIANKPPAPPPSAPTQSPSAPTQSPSAPSPSSPSPSASAAALPPSSSASVDPSSPSEPALAWLRAYGGSGADALKAIAATGSAVYGAVDGLDDDGHRDAAIVSFSPDGDLLWEQGLTNHEDLDVRAIAVSGDRVMVAGLFEKHLEGGKERIDAKGAWGVFLAELASDTGAVRTLRAYGGKGFAIAGARLAMAADENGVVLGGAFAGTIDLGCGETTAAGSLDGFVARIDPKGKCAFVRALGDAQDQAVDSVAIEASGEIAIGGELTGAIDFGGGKLTSEGGRDLFVANLDAKGAPLWTHRIGRATSKAGVARVAVNRLGAVALAGWTEANELQIARFAPGGKLEVTRSIQATAPRSIGFAMNDDAEALLVLPFEGSLELGDGASMPSRGKTDLALLSLDAKGVITHATQLGDPDSQCEIEACTSSATAFGSTFYAGGFFEHHLTPTVEAVGGDAFLLKLR
ncbi:MAG: hypothetical protein U0414_17195 [Polyangiaceae bacterium]